MLLKLYPIFFSLLAVLLSKESQAQKTVLIDISHGTHVRMPEAYKEEFFSKGLANVLVNEKEINENILKESDVLLLFSPTLKFGNNEKEAIKNFLNSGGSLLLVFDEERRTSLETTGVNDLIAPFGLELTENAPVRHNCGAKSEVNEVCMAVRELPYSGGRSIKGGKVISRVYDEGDYVHSAYALTKAGGKIIVMSDGMASILLGEPDGVRFSGTGPSDSKYWGKDSKIFMEEILAFLLK